MALEEVTAKGQAGTLDMTTLLLGTLLIAQLEIITLLTSEGAAVVELNTDWQADLTELTELRKEETDELLEDVEEAITEDAVEFRP